jgi:Tat protein translocase TatB subunit
MLGIGLWEWLVLLALALVVVGPRKLPEVARTLGQWTRELRQVTRDLRLTLEVELDEEETRRRRRQIQERRNDLSAGATPAPGPLAEEQVTADGVAAVVATSEDSEQLDEEDTL